MQTSLADTSSQKLNSIWMVPVQQRILGARHTISSPPSHWL